MKEVWLFCETASLDMASWLWCVISMGARCGPAIGTAKGRPGNQLRGAELFPGKLWLIQMCNTGVAAENNDFSKLVKHCSGGRVNFVTDGG